MSRTTAPIAQQIKYYWKGEPKMDTEGIYYDSVSIARPSGSFLLRQFDTVQLEAPDDDKPYVGTILRLYEADNKKKTADVEWFYLKDEILEFSPKNHKNQHIEDKEVFLAEGEVEVVDNVLGSIRNPCYIVYLSPQDSLVEANQKAMVKCPYFQLYFCRYSYNASKNMTFPISAAWRQNKFIVDHWSDLSEEMKTYIRYELTLSCFKNLSAAAPKTSGASKSKKDSAGSTTSATNSTTAATTSTKANSSDRKSTGLANNVSDKNKDSHKKKAAPVDPPKPVKIDLKPTKTGITPEQVTQWDVVELAKRLSYQDVSSSESDSDSDDSEPAPAARVPKSENELILSRWEDLTDRKRKLYIRDARAMKEKFVDNAATGSGDNNADRSTASLAPRAAATSKQDYHKHEESPHKATEPNNDSDDGSGGSSDSDASSVSASAFEDIDQEAYQALQAELALPNVRDETIAYKLFCYDLAQNEDSSDSSSSEEEVRYTHYGKKADPAKPAVALTAKEKAAEKAARREAELFKEWSDVSFRKMITYVRRAQRLCSYHAFLQRHPKAAPLVTTASKNGVPTTTATSNLSNSTTAARATRGAPSAAAEAKPKELSEEDAPYANILAAMDADAEEYDMAFLWMCVDLANGVQNAGDSSAKGSSSGSASSGTENAVMEGQFLRREWANLTDRKRGYYYERVRQLRDTYRPNSTSKASGNSQARRSTSVPNSPVPARSQQGRFRATSVSSNTNQKRNVPKTMQPKAQPLSDSSSDSDNTMEQVALPQNEDITGDGISADLMHAIKSGMGRYEIALQLLAADLSSSDESDTSSEEEVITRKRMSTGSMKPQPAAMTYQPKKSFQTEMDKIVVKFSDISQRSKNSYMAKAKELQQLYGNGEEDENASFMAGRSTKSRVQTSVSSSLPKPLPASGSAKNAPVSAKRDRRDPSQDVSTNNILDKPRSRRPSMDYAVPSPSKPRRHSTGAPLLARLNDAKPKAAAVVKAVPAPPSSPSDSDSDLQSVDEDEVEQKPEKPRTNWRAVKKLRLEQAAASRKIGRDRYRKATEEAALAKSSGKNKPDSRHSAVSQASASSAGASKGRPVHALIPAHLLLPQQDSEEDSDSVESVEPAPSRQRNRQKGRFARGATASDGENSGIEEFTEEATLSKRSRQRNSRYSEPIPKSRRLSITGTNSGMRSRVSGASMVSNEDSEGNESDAGTEDLESALQVQSRYGTRARGIIALGDKADIHGEFLLHASPKNREHKKDGYTPARVGEDFQVEVPSTLEFEQQRQTATESGRSMVTRGSSVGSALYWGASTLSISLKPKAETDTSSVEEIITTYLSMAWVVVDRLKAEKLSDYYQTQREALLSRAEPKPSVVETVEGETESSTTGDKSTASAVKDVDVIDKSFVTINKEVEELLLSNFFSSNGNVDLALEQVEDLVASHLVLWTAAEQLAITQAFEKFGMNRRSLRTAVPDKSFGEVWDYTLKFLASAVELEDNTTYTDSYGTERCMPQPATHANDSEDVVKARGADFIKRLSVSIDETSFWQFLFVLSSAMKTGEGTPAQLVVKLHYVLNKAEYKDGAELKHSPDQTGAGSEATISAPMEIDETNLTMDGRTENSTVLSGSMVFDVSESTSFPAENASQESDAVKIEVSPSAKPQAAESAVQRYRCKAEAIQDFNQFLPVMVGRL